MPGAALGVDAEDARLESVLHTREKNGNKDGSGLKAVGCAAHGVEVFRKRKQHEAVHDGLLPSVAQFNLKDKVGPEAFDLDLNSNLVRTQRGTLKGKTGVGE